MKKGFTLLSLFTVLFVWQSHTANAQIYKFQQFKTDMGLGLSNQFVYSIAQDKNGFIWFATGLGPCRYNGFKFTSPEGELSATNVIQFSEMTAVISGLVTATD